MADFLVLVIVLSLVGLLACGLAALVEPGRTSREEEDR